MFRAGLYARVSTHDQQTLPMQNRAMRQYAARRGWKIAMQVREVGSGGAKREAREEVLEAARRREIDLVLVGRLDRWGRSVTDLLATLQEAGASGGRVRFSGRGAGPDNTGRSSDGRTVGYFRRVRKGDTTRTHASWHGSCARERGNLELHQAGAQQIRDRTSSPDRPHFRSAHSWQKKNNE